MLVLVLCILVVNDSNLSWHTVHLSLFFTMFNLENTLSHAQLVAGIMVNIFNTKYILLSTMSNRIHSLLTSLTAHKQIHWTYRLVIRHMTLISVSSSSIGILNSLDKIFEKLLFNTSINCPQHYNQVRYVWSAYLSNPLNLFTFNYYQQTT